MGNMDDARAGAARPASPVSDIRVCVVDAKEEAARALRGRLLENGYRGARRGPRGPDDARARGLAKPPSAKRPPPKLPVAAAPAAARRSGSSVRR